MLMGPALPIISGLFLAYALFGQYLPGPLQIAAMISGR
jgi:TRAP-type uncharacterized transport system fused permease subunit